MDLNQQKRVVRAYYASVSLVDLSLVGKILDALEETGQRDKTIVIFTSDHGYHLGEHDLWQKVSIHEESVKVLSYYLSAREKACCCLPFLTELIDLLSYSLQVVRIENTREYSGQDISGMLDDPSIKVRDAVLSSGKGRLLRTEKWLFSITGERELYNMEKDPK